MGNRSATGARAFVAASLVIGSIAAVACGARTPLNDGTGGRADDGSTNSSSGLTNSATSASSSSASTSVSSSTGPPCLSDAECADAVSCTVDTCTPTGCVHTPDNTACDDGVFCTVDQCDPNAGCTHTHSDAICDDGLSCTTDYCDFKDDSCHNDPCDSQCNDGLFCNGVERCDSKLGCVQGPPACELGLGCSNDSCDETTDKCKHQMPANCAPNVHLLVVGSSGALLDVRPYTGVSTQIANGSGAVYLDIAILTMANGTQRWFALDALNLYELKPNTNQIVSVLPGVSANSLGAGPDGFLYAAGTNVFRINPNSGVSTIIGALPAGESSSGDIVFFNGDMIISTDGPCGGGLAKFDPATGVSTTLGGDGLGCVYGLAAKNGTIFMINCDGTIGTFDPLTGRAQVLTNSTITAYGADAL